MSNRESGEITRETRTRADVQISSSGNETGALVEARQVSAGTYDWLDKLSSPLCVKTS